MTKGAESFWSGWQERLAALRQVPPVLKIVWESGPSVVALGIVIRVLVSLLPIALLAVSKFIIDAIVNVVAHHQPVSSPLLVAGGGGVRPGAAERSSHARSSITSTRCFPTSTPATSASKSCATPRSWT